MTKINRGFVLFNILLVLLILSLLYPQNIVFAAINEQINYQGKLLDATSAPVPDGTYHIAFNLYTTETGGSPIWSSTTTVPVTSGLFSYMLGSTTSLAGVDFNQTLYLSVNIGGNGGTPSWDGEMTPRKILGAVPAAFEANNAQTLDNIATSSFLRSDQADSIAATVSSPLLTITQSGTGDILNLFDGGTEVFSVLDGGKVGIGSSTPTYTLSVAGDAIITGALYDSSNSAGSNGYVLQTTGSGTRWVATSSLGFLSSESNALESSITGIQDTEIFIGNGANSGTFTAISGDATLANTGVLTLASSITSVSALPNLATVGTITTGTWNGTSIADAYIDNNITISASGTIDPQAITLASGNVLIGDASNNAVATSSLYIASNGNVGIVTTSPSDTLTIRPSAAGAGVTVREGDDGFDAIRLRGWNGQGVVSLYQAGVENIKFDAAGNSYFNVGNVGIGTTSPTFALDVNGDINFASGNALKIAGTDVLTASTTNRSVTLGQGAGAALLPDGLYNTAIGINALDVATSSDGNTAVGYLALSSNITGSYNSAQGVVSLYSNTTGSYNSAQGPYALYYNTTGSYNSAQGIRALFSNTTGSNQVAVGYNAGRYIADGITANASSGNSVYLGAGTRAFADGDTNEIVIGYNAIGIGSNTVVLGNDSIVTTALKGNVGIGTTSPSALLTVGAANNFTVTSAGVVTNGTWNGTAITDAYISDTLTIGASGSVSDSALSANVSLLGQSIEESELNITGTPTDGYLLQASSTSAGGFAWVATSTLGLGGGGVSTFLDLSDTPSAYTANRLIFTNSGATALTDSANLVFDGTTLSAGRINLADASVGYQIGGIEMMYATSSTNGIVSLGYRAGLNGPGNRSVAIGYNALLTATSSATQNVAIGYNVLDAVTDGYGNVGIGYNTLTNLTSGATNMAIGDQSMRDNITGSANVGVGASSLLNIESGTSNVAIGELALSALISGTNNVAIGDSSLTRSNATNSVAIGYQAGLGAVGGNFRNVVLLGYRTGYSLDTGADGNILIGFQTGNALTTGSNNIAIGYDIDLPSNTASNQLNIGNLIFGTGIDGIGTAISSGGIAIGTSTASNARFSVQTTGTTDILNLYETGGGEVFTVLESGNVGVGITSPTFALDVNGDINFASGNALKIAGTDVLTASTTNRSVTLGQGAGAALLPDGLYNTAIGINALDVATSSDGNTAVGYLALSANTTGSYNSAQGYGALRSNTTGSNNSAQGRFTLRSNTTGSYNSAQGSYALYSNTTGSNNSAQGYAALLTNTTGSYNSAQGTYALSANTTGSYNSAQGYVALRNNTTGSYNSAQGYAALYSNTTGSYNSAQGYLALYSNTTGSNQVAVGYSAGRYIADGITANATSSNSVYLGAGTRAFADGDTNEIVIGYNAIGIGSNTVVLGNDSIVTTALKGNVGIGTTTPVRKLQVFGDIRLGNSGTNGCVEDYGGGVLVGTCASDERLKTDITPLSEEEGSVLENLVALTPVTYTWNEVAHDKYAKGMNLTNTGLIAQDVEAVFPELVSENKDGFKQVNFTALPYYIIQAIKDMWQVVTGNTNRIDALEEENKVLKEKLKDIESMINNLSENIDADSTQSANVQSTNTGQDHDDNSSGTGTDSTPDGTTNTSDTDDDTASSTNVANDQTNSQTNDSESLNQSISASVASSTAESESDTGNTADAPQETEVASDDTTGGTQSNSTGDSNTDSALGEGSTQDATDAQSQNPPPSNEETTTQNEPNTEGTQDPSTTAPSDNTTPTS